MEVGTRLKMRHSSGTRLGGHLLLPQIWRFRPLPPPSDPGVLSQSFRSLARHPPSLKLSRLASLFISPLGVLGPSLSGPWPRPSVRDLQTYSHFSPLVSGPISGVWFCPSSHDPFWSLARPHLFQYPGPAQPTFDIWPRPSLSAITRPPSLKPSGWAHPLLVIWFRPSSL